jgi:hypothetical protein
LRPSTIPRPRRKEITDYTDSKDFTDRRRQKRTEEGSEEESEEETARGDRTRLIFQTVLFPLSESV